MNSSKPTRRNTGIASNVAIHKVCGDLLAKGYFPFLPTGEYYLPYDLIVATPTGTYLRFQVKHSNNGVVPAWRQGYNAPQKYNSNDFDYYALYLPSIDKVVYPNISFAGIVIATEPRASATDFWWYEDFLNLTDGACKRSHKDFNLNIKGRTEDRPLVRKCVWPTESELKQLLWQYTLRDIGKQFGVSSNAVTRWAKKYNLETPPVGYWLKTRLT